LLSRAIAEFITRLNRSGMSDASAHRLPQLLRIARYYEAVAELAREVALAADEYRGAQGLDPALAERDAAFRRGADVLLAQIHPDRPPESTGTIDDSVHELEADYQRLKAELLEAGTQGRLAVSAMDAQLRAASALHRALDQAVKAIRLLASDLPAR
jgi:phosphate:Na+ symporter